MAQSELEKNNSPSGGEEEVSSGGSESESESEKTPPPPASTRKPLATPNSSSEESESNTDSPPKKSEKADPNIKPLASKPMEDEQLKQSRPKNPTSRYSPPPLKSITGKRKADEVEVEVKNAGEKKVLFQRLWSEDDEVELIKGMISYVEKKGKNPIVEFVDFHGFVKNALKIDVSYGQTLAKIKRLKAKFRNNADKLEQKGKVRSLSQPHEKKMFELSKKLWGSNTNKKALDVSCSTKKVDAKPKTNQLGKNTKSAVSDELNPNAVAKVIRIPITDEDIMKKGLESLSGTKKLELEEKWNNLKMQELKHFLKKLDLVQEQSHLVLSVLEKSGSS